MSFHLGIDTGGTFTDFFLVREGRVTLHKELSTPEAPERAILRGLAALGLEGQPGIIVHGSTVATNAVLESRLARVVYLANRGFTDVLAIGRQAREALYDLKPLPRPPPVPAEDCVGTGGRLGADGTLLEPLTDADLAAAAEAVAARAPQAVAINLLFSWLEPALEQRLAAAMPPGLFVCCSVDVLPEMREYERGIATWLNAAVGPLMQGYLGRLEAAAAPARVRVMQSSGLAASPAYAGLRAVNLLLSGPAGGLMGARHLARTLDLPRVLTFDMGGTSTDVAFIDGEPALTTEGHIGPWPVGVPMVEVHTIGAGGGSLARVDEGGLLRVGPGSAGARPGPACYGAGGLEPTVTDAHVVLGRLPSSALLAGTLPLDVQAAQAAYARLGQALGGLSAAEAAEGVVALANTHMHQALRVISVEQGHDPASAVLMSFGGAGGLHVCELAASLGMREAVVPAAAGVLSALGMLAVGEGRQAVRTLRRDIATCPPAFIARQVDELASALHAELGREDIDPAGLTTRSTLDLCYEGQAHVLSLPWTGDDPATAFAALHRQRYGHDLARTVILVAVRVRVAAPGAAFSLPGLSGDNTASPVTMTRVHGIDAPVGVWSREQLIPERAYPGPLVVLDALGTTWVAPGWTLVADALGHLRLRAHCAPPSG